MIFFNAYSGTSTKGNTISSANTQTSQDTTSATNSVQTTTAPSTTVKDTTKDTKTSNSATSSASSSAQESGVSSTLAVTGSLVSSKNSESSNTGSTHISATTTSASAIVITASNTISSDTGTKPTLSAVQITAVNTLNSGSASGLPGLSTALPTLSSTGATIPTVTVPSNANNPFMKQSSLPEGTVFIAVGSILLGIALAVIGWNIAMFIIARNSKYIDYTPAGGFGTKGPGDSKTAFSGDHSKTLEGSEVGTSGVTGGAAARVMSQVGFGGGNDNAERTRSMYNSGLFFSPTAEVMNNAQHQGAVLPGSTPGAADSLTSTVNSAAGVGVSPSTLGAAAAASAGATRTSVYMPSGYYAPATSAGITGNTTMSIYSTAGTNTNNRNTIGPTRESVRAPSAYLDDFLGQDS
ncbi:uncharacterized protein SAPINGB_P003299 [Magnusiomyces paraingens]|uniref:Uncharacterized protein n=1 Tax=Magnusiomyces paraingens TaxID=2606893 RepID=A0A5E8BK49_9ASCO|nr:uncharacterized protein SAPINGB_P003299 [Saprochaete ingens]VVT52046.1 unnamed protein product [Saprochaete ingens]